MRPTSLPVARLAQGIIFLFVYTFVVVYFTQSAYPTRCPKCEPHPPHPADKTECPPPIKCPTPEPAKCPPATKCPEPTKCPDPVKCPEIPKTDCSIDCPVNCEVDCAPSQVATKKPEEKVDPFYDGPFEYQVDAAYQHMLNLIKTHTIECNDVRFLGFHGQGGDAKRPEGTWPVCWHNFKNCKILTFGVADDPGFENQFAKASGCKIWAHDPTVSGYGLQLEDGVTFVKLGLGGEDTDSGSFPVRKLSTLMERVGIESMPVLKVDVEGAEWAFLREALDSGTLQKVGQLMIEVHFWPHVLPSATSHHEMVRTWYRILKDLTTAGFRLFDYHENPFSTYPVNLFTRGPAACCHEIGFININYNSTGYY